MKFDRLIIHYDEIGLKGKNRPVFENALVRNIRNKPPLAKASEGKIKKGFGRILIQDFTGEKGECREALSQVFGIANFSFAVKVDLDLDEIKKKVLELLKNEEFESFRITTRRSNKNFALTSQKINEQVGEEVVKKLNKKVDLENPDLTCFIEIAEKQAYIYLEKIAGPGGLPVGVGGKVVALLSGGIDSPVAAWYAAKRGLQNIFVHFHSIPYTSAASVNKVKELAEQLENFCGKSKLYLVPFGDLQKQIMMSVPEKLRVIFYRRFMLRIAEQIAEKEGALGIITGEALGQVASQTLENIGVVQQAVDLPVLRPLVGFDKKEIVEKAKQIGTYEISILPHEDCCTLFMPKRPETKARLDEVLLAEDKLNVKELTEESKQYIDNIK